MAKKDKHKPVFEEDENDVTANFKKLTELEKSGDESAFRAELIKSDKRFYAQPHYYGSIFRDQETLVPHATSLSDAMIQVMADRNFRCDCIKKLAYTGLHVSGSISGPSRNRDFFRNGFIGAVRQSTTEYTIVNHGGSGKARLPMNGNLDLIHRLEGLSKGRYYVLLKGVKIRIAGSACILGQGNFSTSIDSRARVEFLSMITASNEVLYQNSKQLYFDQTKSEVRSKDFFNDFVFVSQAIPFEVRQDGLTIQWLNRLRFKTEANEEGYVGTFADIFGFESTLGPEQVDLLVIKA